MILTKKQKICNQLFFSNILTWSNSYFYLSAGLFFEIKNNKYVIDDEEKYKCLSQHTTKKWFKKNTIILKPT